MFQSTGNLFGSTSTPSVQQIESKVPENAAAEATDGENFDQYVDGTYSQYGNAGGEITMDEPQPVQERNDFYCDKCGNPIAEKVWDYSMEHYDRPLCYKCQKIVKGGNR